MALPSCRSPARLRAVPTKTPRAIRVSPTHLMVPIVYASRVAAPVLTAPPDLAIRCPPSYEFGESDDPGAGCHAPLGPSGEPWTAGRAGDPVCEVCLPQSPSA